MTHKAAHLMMDHLGLSYRMLCPVTRKQIMQGSVKSKDQGIILETMFQTAKMLHANME